MHNNDSPAREVRIGPLALPGLACEPTATGWVAFAHGSGSSRLSPRNQEVAAMLRARGLGTLLLDLLTESEALHRSLVFDIALLATRLGWALDWLESQGGEGARPVGLFGASTGGAAALWAAAEQPHRVSAVVSRGGRPDLAAARLAAVHAPTLLVVGGLDREVLRLNREALAQLGGERRLEVVPGATHLFEEPGALEAMGHLAADWFANHLPPPPTP